MRPRERPAPRSKSKPLLKRGKVENYKSQKSEKTNQSRKRGGKANLDEKHTEGREKLLI